LIEIKDPHRRHRHPAAAIGGSRSMSIETAIVVATITLAFVFFAATMAWAAHVAPGPSQ
jgi:hypothetical protein